MDKTIIKRNGSIVPFDKLKIAKAIERAFLSVDKTIDQEAVEYGDRIANNIEENWKPDLTVENVQDMVETQLMSGHRKDVAQAYIRYRYEHALAREKYSELIDAVQEKLEASNVQNQNANLDEHSFGGRMGEMGSAVSTTYALDYIMSPKAKYNHQNNRIYTHDLNSYAVGMHNCFDPSTTFITSKGVKSFNDFVDGDKVSVLGPDGNWHNAVVKYYGKQKLNKYLFKKNRTEIEIMATSNHRWIMKDGSVKEGLKVGDKLFDSPYCWEDFSFEDLSNKGKFYWCLGFVMGDGTKETRYDKTLKEYRKNGTCKVKLCGDKAKYLYRFQECGYGLNCSAKEPEVSGIPYDKTIPCFDNLPVEYAIAYIHGLYDADGCHATARSTGKPIFSIQSSNKDVCDFIEKYFPVAGLYINSIRDKTGQETNFGVRGYTKEYSFFGLPSIKFIWAVKSIIPVDNELHDVWCLEVEDVHSFILENGIPTGNCLTLPLDDLFANGFNTRQTDIRAPKSVSTAFQLLAVTFQTQSLCQFGGVASGHIDWTMVPYVRMSFYKHYKDGIKYIDTFASIPEFDINRSIDDNVYKRHSKAYQYALDMTAREVHQSVEGAYHNLKKLGRLNSNVKNLAA